ncbi:hypothetical protein H0H93_009001 [Arthromyces matolae]|nr:hypothetical protein H0H93_009001 [Arthromyces matolae]
MQYQSNYADCHSILDDIDNYDVSPEPFPGKSAHSEPSTPCRSNSNSNANIAPFNLEASSPQSKNRDPHSPANEGILQFELEPPANNWCADGDVNIVTDPSTETIDRIINELFYPDRTDVPRTHVVSYEGTHQYKFGNGVGSAACGLAASNFVLEGFKGYDNLYVGGRPEATQRFLGWLLSKPCAHTITDICEDYKQEQFLEVEEIVGAPRHKDEQLGCYFPVVQGVPYFTNILETLSPITNCLYTRDSVRRILRELTRQSGISAAIITKTPEVFACMRIPLSSHPTRNIYVMFDSHTAPRYHPSGAAMILCDTVDALVNYILARRPIDPVPFSEVDPAFDPSQQVVASLIKPRVLVDVVSDVQNMIAYISSMELLNRRTQKRS